LETQSNLRMKRLFVLLVVLVFTLSAYSQNERKFIRKGNNYFMDGVADTTKLDTIRFGKAEAEYRKALEKKPHDLKWNFNLGDAEYKQMKFNESISTFDEVAQQTDNKVEKARAYHNKGNSLLFSQKLDESIETYKQALRNNPNDIDTKYNLAYAQRLKKQQQQQQQQNKNQNNKDQQNKDQQNQDKNKQDQNKDQQNKDQQNQNKDQPNKNQQQQQQQQQAQNKISKENAEQLLQALQNDEQKVQDKVKKAQVMEAKRVKVEKDW
jgi:Ca-activated chloride channel homolog